MTTNVRVILKAPEAQGWRFSVWLDEGRIFVGHAMGWLEAQQCVLAYLDDVVRTTVQPVLDEVLAEERDARMMELVRKPEPLTRPERAELSRLKGEGGLNSPEVEQHAVEMVKRALEDDEDAEEDEEDATHCDECGDEFRESGPFAQSLACPGICEDCYVNGG